MVGVGVGVVVCVVGVVGVDCCPTFVNTVVDTVLLWFLFLLFVETVVVDIVVVVVVFVIVVVVVFGNFVHIVVEKVFVYNLV